MHSSQLCQPHLHLCSCQCLSVFQPRFFARQRSSVLNKELLFHKCRVTQPPVWRALLVTLLVIFALVIVRALSASCSRCAPGDASVRIGRRCSSEPVRLAAVAEQNGAEGRVVEAEADKAREGCVQGLVDSVHVRQQTKTPDGCPTQQRP